MAPTPHRLVRGIGRFDAQMPDDLSFDVGDVLTVIGEVCVVRQV